jgi:chromosome segregation ATPase
MERKVSRASGQRTPQEQTELKAKIAELTESLENYTSQFGMLTTQCKRLSNELKQAKRQAEESEKEANRHSSAIAELEMKNTSGERHLKGLIKEKEEGMVSHDVLKLEVKRLREQLNAKADEVFGLQNRKFQLQMSMEERQQEIKVHTEVLRAQLKASNAACRILTRTPEPRTPSPSPSPHPNPSPSPSPSLPPNQASNEERHTAARELSERLIKVDLSLSS